jgi:transcriptional regulator with XRE-family HTH domain
MKEGGWMTGIEYQRRGVRNKLTQKQLADKIGVSPKTISYWETGRNKPSSENLLKLALILKCTPELLLKEF